MSILSPHDRVLARLRNVSIGIHGLGAGAPPWIQRSANWTDGCVALTPAQMSEFARWARVGTRVVIR